MHINLSSGNTFMSQHLLNSTQIGSVFQKMGRKGVSEGMGTYSFFNPCSLSQSFHQRENHGPGELAPPSVEKQDIFGSIFYRHVNTDLVFIQKNVLYRCGGDGDKALFVSFACYAYKTFFKE